jgi:hypothetical protein
MGLEPVEVIGGGKGLGQWLGMAVVFGGRAVPGAPLCKKTYTLHMYGVSYREGCLETPAVVPLLIWLAFCLFGVVDWVRNGREKTNKSYFDNRAR